MMREMAQPRIKLWVWVAVALATGTALRLYFLHVAPKLTTDTLLYGDIAKNLIQHHVFGFTVSESSPRPTLIRVPGYPLLLALCFLLFGIENYHAVLYIQLLIDLATCLLVADLARRLWGKRAGIAAVWLAALCPFTANYVGSALTETVTLFFIATTLNALHRWSESTLRFNRWLWLIAGSLSAAILIRPEQGLLAAVIVPSMVWIGARSRISAKSPLPRRLLPVLVAAFCIVLPLAPWAARNWHTFHVIQPLAPRSATDPGEHIPLGFQRWYRTWAIEFASNEYVYWNYDSNDIKITDLPTRAFDSPAQRTETAKLLADYNLTDSDSPTFDARFNTLASERITAHPIRYYLVLPVARLANMLFRPRLELTAITLEWWQWREDRKESTFAYAYALLNLIYMVLGVRGFIRWKSFSKARSTPALPAFAGHAPLAIAMAAYVALRCALLLTLDNSEDRYTLELFPIFILCASILFKQKEASVTS
jgi:4-amino-4-deoxy-L-arabinose transferase-like glycosyltransferase